MPISGLKAPTIPKSKITTAKSPARKIYDSGLYGFILRSSLVFSVAFLRWMIKKKNNILLIIGS